MTLFGEEQTRETPTQARAKDLYMEVDVFGEPIYTADEIIATLKAEGFDNVPQNRSTLSRWASEGNWKAGRAALISSALIDANAIKGEGGAITSVVNLAEYAAKTQDINKKSLDLLERFIDTLSEKKTISLKEAATVVKIVEATGKINEKLIDKLADDEGKRTTAKEVLRILQKAEAIPVDFE